MTGGLDVEALTHRYPDGTLALDRVGLQVPAGLFGLLGPNGAGKSTLMRVLATLVTPTGGRVRLDGLDAVADPQRWRAGLGYLPQDFGVYPHVSAERLLDHIATLKGLVHRAERRGHVEALLAAVNLWSVRRRPLAALSGGMRQRFGIAQALLGAPALVVVDEPTSGLDPEERGRCLDLLAAAGERAVVLLSTHIVADVADLCPRMAVLIGGRVALEGAPDELVGGLAGRIWRAEVSREALTALRRDHAVISTRLVAGRTVAHVLAEGRPAAGFDLVPPELDDVYFAALPRAEPA